jgi:hypothetical protein
LRGHLIGIDLQHGDRPFDFRAGATREREDQNQQDQAGERFMVS